MIARLLLLALVLSVMTLPPASAEPTTTPTSPTPITKLAQPKIKGTARYGKTLTIEPAKYQVHGATVTTRWLRNGEPIKGGYKNRYKLRPEDVDQQIQVRVIVREPGEPKLVLLSKSRKVKHVRDVRHTVKYTVSTNGSISTSVDTFAKQVDQTLNDPRGWRAAGIKFTRVKSGGSMNIVLAQASRVPTYSSGCSSMWSCRAGRYVIINQERWKHASSAWNAAKGTTLRDYRHMVVNHETGHWLGRGHASCNKRGSLAPVMMQQSKGLSGCKFNPWPTTSELNVPRYR